MSADDAPEPDAPAGTDDEAAPAQLFGEWDVTEIEFSDPSTERYVTVTPIAHTMGRHSEKQFKKSEISIVERLINRLMQTDENTGKKQLATTIVKDAFETIHERTEENPVQVLVEAVENSAPREETVRLKYGGISVPKAVDVAPQRRVDQALKFLAEGVYGDSFKTTTDAEDALAQQLIGAANNDVQTYAVNQKEEKERVAAAAR
ncbi:MULTISPECIES: 30S ribosomal protein S7 [Halomicrobium]|uniref:Small ribosomal subunit protein uS7 n=2 Tax=Halomicrobium mukohataei TaxID=57705 RepID=C7NYI2_HALMD|nr:MULTISPECIES: 30S ribosomal protein S7 [Halomicrobium]ACV46643.1 ribosomal protein S7 [Halomicrobium mukohataei DSM 12286]MBO4247446.1 30S ribosomal protein S7 [Halomicrobium sp. IBSBa]NLV08756.1 30S ribosomal protein S7 [Halomicrobium mukohataei]QCD65153.1 30S ribosomal protein S7 [Halomicrobium mukohataei]QFR19959.1 30S ribosomal protein S7 [Halomicrobium sp. ZPS1]